MCGGIIKPSLLYGCEVWTLKVRERKGMEAVEVNCLRNICGLRRIDRVLRLEIRRKCEKNVSVSQRIDQDVLRWFGHVERMGDERMASRVIESDVRGVRRIGRAKKGWMDGVKEVLAIKGLNSVNILGLQISSSLSWRDHIVQIAKSASKKLGVLFRCKQYFNSAQLFKLYTGFIRPCLEYCSHIWGSSPYTSLLDRVESKAIRLISDPSLTSTLDSLSLRRKVASLSLFYRYYFGHCSDELATCIPPPMARPRSTRQATFAHNYCVELSNARINRFSNGFFPSTSHLWNSLPSAVFLASFNLPSFKRQVYHHLRDQMA